MTELNCEDFKIKDTKECVISDLKYDRDHKILHFLDTNSGVHKYHIEEEATQSAAVRISNSK